MTTPPGPFKDQPVTEIPTRYLRWIIANVSRDEYPEYIAAVEEELKFRDNFKRESEVTL